MKLLFIVLFAVISLAANAAELVPQCKCDDVKSCKDKFLGSIDTCANECQEHPTKAGADFKKLRACISSDHEGKIKSALKCFTGKYSDSCAESDGEKVEKRYPEPMKIAAFAEINRILIQSGINPVQGPKILSHIKNFSHCMHKCMDNKADNCVSKHECGLKLPSDNAIIDQLKTCFIENGFDTKGVQELCKCGLESGIKDFEGVCSKLEIS